MVRGVEGSGWPKWGRFPEKEGLPIERFEKVSRG